MVLVGASRSHQPLAETQRHGNLSRSSQKWFSWCVKCTDQGRKPLRFLIGVFSVMTRPRMVRCGKSRALAFNPASGALTFARNPSPRNGRLSRVEALSCVRHFRHGVGLANDRNKQKKTMGWLK